MLKDSVQRYVRDDYDFSKRRAIAATEQGMSRECWSTFADLGWLGMAIPEAYGGLGGGPVDVMILMEAFGAGLVLEPYVPSVVIGAGLLALAGQEEQKLALLPQVAEGKLLLALAAAEPRSRFSLNDVSTEATADGDSWLLRGHKSVVLAGPAADKFLVTARTSGARRDEDGISMFLVDRNATGLDRTDARGFDRGTVCELRLDSVRVGPEALVGSEGAMFPVLEKVIDHAIAAVCAEAVGAMQVLNDATAEYLKQRKQFGQPIGRFQVLQHRMVDMLTELEQTRSLTFLATMKLDAQRAERRHAASCAKAQMGKAGKFVGAQSVQLHGGMGMTDELMVSHYYKRLMMLDIVFGNRDHHLKAFTALTQP